MLKGIEYLIVMGNVFGLFIGAKYKGSKLIEYFLCFMTFLYIFSFIKEKFNELE